ncbi:sulfurtransferase TusA family protein [Marinimicrobium sp. ARAG 43.8]|uniref:sulfurtransferase TusA family protein n=1 Tax=Marinimicrobium sp. ARAG 43.8 TaxID=3418719 RepID=UPI003CE72BE8
MKRLSDLERFVVREVDARELRCPMPLLKAKQALRESAPGEAVRILATDRGSVRDFQSYAELAGLALARNEDSGGVYEYILLKS